MDLFNATDRLEKARKRQMDHGWRQQTPGYSEYATEAIRDLAPTPLDAAAYVPGISDAADAALTYKAMQEGRWKEALLYGGALALPFISAPMLNRGLAMLERRMGPVGDVPADPNALMSAATQAASPVGGQAQIFLGQTARNADLEALERAKEMAAQGASAEDIWRATAPSDPTDPRTGWWVPTERGPQPPGGAPLFELTEPPNLRIRQRPEGDQALLEALQEERDRAAAAIRMRNLMDRDGVSAEDAASTLVLAGRYASAGVDDTSVAMAESMSETALNKVLNDAKAQVSKIAEKGYPLRELMDYPDLYQAMPEVAEIPTYVKQMPPGEGGYYADKFDPGGERIVLNEAYSDNPPPLAGLSPAPSHRAVLATHEVGHAVQGNTPGFPRGGSPKTAPARAQQAIVMAESDLKTAERKARQAFTKERVLQSAKRMRDAGIAPNTPLPVLTQRFPNENPSVLYQALQESARPDLDARLAQATQEASAANRAMDQPKVTLANRRRVATMAPYDQYLREEGEAASRMMERRAGLPVSVRRDRPAWIDADVPLEELIP